MPVQWLNEKEVERAIWVRETNTEFMSVAQGKIGLPDSEWNQSQAYSLKMNSAQHLGVTAWLLDEDAGEARRYFRMAAETRLDWLAARGPLVTMIIRPLGDEVIRQSEAGDFRDIVPKMSAKTLQGNLKRFANAAEGEVIQTETGKGIRYQGWIMDDKHQGPHKTTIAVECALAAGDPDLARRVVEQSNGPRDFDTYLPTRYPMGEPYVQALRYSLLDDAPKPREYLRELDKEKSALCRRLGNSYSALLDNDAAGVGKEFKEYLAEFRKKAVPPKLLKRYEGKVEPPELIDFEFLLSIPGLAFCNLAASRGIKLEVDEPFLPKQIQNA